jgi:hypothetical protein
METKSEKEGRFDQLPRKQMLRRALDYIGP